MDAIGKPGDARDGSGLSPADLPRWLTGDWGVVIRDPVDLMRLALLVGAPLTLTFGPREQSFRLLLTFAVTLVPRALDAPRLFDLAFVTAMSFQAWGNIFGAFDGIYGYDKVVHFALPCAASALLYLLLVRIEVMPDLADQSGVRRRPAILLVTTAFGLALMGGIYELYEWFADHHLGAHLYVSYGDSIGDLLDDAIGALAGGALILVWEARGWGTRRRPLPPPEDSPEEDPVAELGDRVVANLQPEDAAAGRSRRWQRSALGGLIDDRSGWVGASLDLLRVSFLAGAVIAAARGDADTALRFAISFAAVFSVRALRAPPVLDLLFIGAMAMQAWGSLASAFAGGGGFDSATHVVVSAAAAVVLYLAVVRLRLLPELSRQTALHQSAALALAAFSLGFSVGIFYEIYFYFADRVIGASSPVDYPLLISRLSWDVAGAHGGALVLVLWGRANWPLGRAAVR